VLWIIRTNRHALWVNLADRRLPRTIAGDAMKIPERWLTDDCVAAAEGRPARTRGIQVFRNATFDRWLARAHPALPVGLFGPAAAVALFASWRAATPLSVVVAFAGGCLGFSLFEYSLHRFIFHRRFADTRSGRIEGFLTHGYHHVYPDDPERLVMPPMGSVPLGALFAFIYVTLFGWPIGLAMFSGTAVGYVLYDTTHFVLHHWRPRTFIGRWMRRYHLLHHHAEEPARFGVSSPLWDLVFGTYGPVGRAAARLRQQADGRRSAT
jgi:sterol desaturase/sphingolipid hydroxylase (fatty acid hydroxylase superfamily)